MGRLLPVAGLVLALWFSPAYADEHETPGEQALEKMQEILDALRNMIDELPLYEAPEILDNGDIIIRRKRPEDAPPQPKDEDVDETST